MFTRSAQRNTWLKRIRRRILRWPPVVQAQPRRLEPSRSAADVRSERCRARRQSDIFVSPSLPHSVRPPAQAITQFDGEGHRRRGGEAVLRAGRRSSNSRQSAGGALLKIEVFEPFAAPSSGQTRSTADTRNIWRLETCPLPADKHGPAPRNETSTRSRRERTCRSEVARMMVREVWMSMRPRSNERRSVVAAGRS